MKIYVFTGFNNGRYVFTFSVVAHSPHRAIELLYNDKTLKDIEFDKLLMEGF